MKKNFLLIAGNPRSGTTFVGKMLALNKSVQYLDEPFNAEFGMVGVKSYFPYISEKKPDQASLHNKKLVDDFFAGNTKFRKLNPKESTNKKQYIGRKLFGTKNNYQYKNLLYNPAIKTGIIKDPTASLLSRYMAKEYNVPVLVIIRHPLATMASFKRLRMKHPIDHLLKQPNLARDFIDKYKLGFNISELNEVEHNSLHWVIMNKILLEFKTQNSNIEFITHESISLDPVMSFRRIYSRYGLKYTHHINTEILKYTSTSNPTQAPSNAMHHLKRNSKENLNNWKVVLTKDEIREIKNLTYDLSLNFYSNDSWV